MKKLDEKAIKKLIEGSSILSTGGGGSAKEAKKVLEKLDVKEIHLADAEDLETEKKAFTCYGVGSTGSDDVDEVKSMKTAIEAFKSETGQNPAGVYPAEMGPLALVDALIVAEKLEIPLLDLDAADGRCVPTIEMNPLIDIEEGGSPFIIAHQTGKKQKIEENIGLKQLEEKARKFASEKESIVFVAGHVHSIGIISEALKKGTLKEALKIGKNSENADSLDKETDLGLVSTGNIEKISVEEQNHEFLESEIIISSENSKFQLDTLNEFTKLEKDGETVIKPPEMIILVDLETMNGIYTGEKLQDREVAIFKKKPVGFWKTQKGGKMLKNLN